MLAFWIFLGAVGGIFLFLGLIGLIKYPSSVYRNEPKERNPLEGKKVVFVADENEKENADGFKGHLEAIGDSDNKKRGYSFIKRLMDIVFSFFALVLLSPILLGLSIAVFVSDPGPVFLRKREWERTSNILNYTNLEA